MNPVRLAGFAQGSVVLATMALLALPLTAAAQSPASDASAAASSTVMVDASKMGVSLSRIRRELSQPETETLPGSPLKLEYRVEVFGVAPKIDLLEGFALEGPMPGSAPTHREVIEFLTPPQFRSPAIPVFAAAQWAADKMAARSRKKRCEAEIAEYRAMLMQGIAIAAPRCTQ